MAVIELAGVKKSFGGKQVLSGLDLEIEKGESVVLLGASGSGKSVTLKLILGLERPDAGRIRAEPAKIGMLFQNGALFDSMPVWENVAFSLLMNLKMDEKRARRIALEKLSEVGLSPQTADLMPASLSGGMKKRVGLARAIATSPEILFFDEPTTGLDPLMGEVINRLIAEQVRRLGATALTITHDIHSARMIASRIVMLENGRITWSGAPAELEGADNEYIRRFVAAAG